MNIHSGKQSRCKKCDEIFDRYEGFNEELREWFNLCRNDIRNIHISCAGRGRKDQEDCFDRGRSNAHYGQSAHNYNMAIDVFFVDEVGAYSLDKKYFDELLSNHPIDGKFEWFGRPGSPYKEMPHIQVLNWKDKVKVNSLPLVEAQGR